MIYDLNEIQNNSLDDRFEFTNISIKEYVDHINSCYEDIGITTEEL